MHTLPTDGNARQTDFPRESSTTAEEYEPQRKATNSNARQTKRYEKRTGCCDGESAPQY